MKKYASLFVSAILIFLLLVLNIAYAGTNTASKQQIFKLTDSESLTLSDFGVKEGDIINNQSKNGKLKHINIKDIKLSDMVRDFKYDR